MAATLCIASSRVAILLVVVLACAQVSQACITRDGRAEVVVEPERRHRWRRSPPRPHPAPPHRHSPPPPRHHDGPLPVEVDWRKEGAVTLPKDQGMLGSCWAFATVAAIEGLHKIKTGRLAALSAQQIVDCSKVSRRTPRLALEWVHKNGGITSEANYPYRGDEGECIDGKLKNFASRITGYKRTDNTSELALMVAVAKQPVAVGMSLDAAFFKNYKAGTIYSGPCTNKNNHAMTVVGYGASKEGKPFWIVKNSFGPHWGDNGYVLVQRGVNAHNGGLCGIAKSAVYPTMW